MANIFLQTIKTVYIYLILFCAGYYSTFHIIHLTHKTILWIGYFYILAFNRYGILRLSLFHELAQDHTVDELYLQITAWLHRRIWGAYSSRNIYIGMFF